MLNEFSYVCILHSVHSQKINQIGSHADEFHGLGGLTLKEFTKGFIETRNQLFTGNMLKVKVKNSDLLL